MATSITSINYKTQLEALLADNTAKQISAQDVRTIVTSNYQPVLIYAGIIFPDDHYSNLNNDLLRTLYYNPDYFGDENIMSPGSTSPWVIDQTGSGITNGTYTNVELLPDPYTSYNAGIINMSNFGGDPGNAFFNVTVSGNVVTACTSVTQGSGWIPQQVIPGSLAAGQTGRLSINGNTSAKLRFNGPIKIDYESGGRNGLTMTTNSTGGNHGYLNTLMNCTQVIRTGGDENTATMAFANPTSFNTYVQNEIALEQQERGAHFQLWRLPQST